MRRVDIYLPGPEGWAGHHRALVVRETQTEVLLMQLGTGRRLKIRRSAFERARPRDIPKNEPHIKASIAALENTNYRVRRWSAPITGTPIFKALLSYIRANLKQRYVRAPLWDRIR